MGDKGETQKSIPGWMNFVIGGISGMMASSIVHPADLTKTRMQLASTTKTMTTLAVARNILKKEGPLGFYTGLSASLFRQATYTSARLGCFSVMFDSFKSKYGTPSFPTKLAMGTVAGGIGAFIGTPTEVVLIRMMADATMPKEKRRNYKHVFNALARIVREEGAMTLSIGSVSTVVRAMMGNAAQLGTYTQAKETLLPHFGVDGMPLHTCSSMIAGLTTSAASLPLDIVKTRVQHAPKGSNLSQMSVLKNIVRKEGVFALWNGFSPSYLKNGPHTVITFVFLEQLNKLYINKFA